MKNVLMVAEKPSLALSIAKILSNGQMKSRKGVSSACQIHEYNGSFNSQQVKFKVTSVCGHVMTLDFKGYFNNWDAVEPVELFNAPTVKKEAMPKLNIVKHLEQEGKGIDYLVLWLDCDKEGENICFEVIDAVSKTMKPSSTREKTIYRAHFSAITDKDIKKAMQNLGEPNKYEALSVDSRLELDLRIGCAFTRYQTRYFQGKYGDLDSSVISYGPCQTPTLGFCVDRHDQIQSFKSETYWKIHVVLQNGIVLDWERMRIFEKEMANLFLNIVKGASYAKITKIQEKEKSKQRPQALNTVELLRVASSGLGIGPQQTMVAAEKLYTQGYISYPRTETTHYPENFDLRGTLRQQTSNQWGVYVNELLQKGMNKPRKGADAGDHPPITPMRPASSSELSGDMWRIYEYVSKHFIATLSYDCKYVHKVVEFDVNNETFTCEGKTTSDAGFTAIFDWQTVDDNITLPNFSLHQNVDIKECKLLEKQTSPPDYLTEAELISLMEKHGIGTDASIPVHINNICQRNYVTVGSSRRLIPTSLGIVLVHGYQKIDVELVLSTMRSSIEKQLNLIASGEAEHNAVTQYYLDIFEQKFEYFMKHIESMDELFECSFTKLSESGKPMSRCGKCRRYMKYIAAKPYRLHCATCDETYTMPQDGFLKLYQELKCPLDDFELLLWSKGPKAKGTPICPFCYSHPPFDEMKVKTGCNGCLHPTCKHALPQLSISACMSCDDGTIVLEPYTAPKWQMSCNKCNGCWKLFKNATKILVTEDECECGALFVDVHFNKEKSVLPDNATRYKGCVFCDPVLTPHVRNVTGASHNITSSNRGNRRGGSRGRRGRGGGGRGRGGRRGKGRSRGRSSDDESGYVSRPPASHNLADFLNF